jgi:hypothetical protein
MVKLKAFDKFENTTDALNAASHLVDSKLPKGLRKFLKAQCQGETLAIADSKLGKAISDKLVSLGLPLFVGLCKAVCLGFETTSGRGE